MQSRYQDMIDAYKEMQQHLIPYGIDIKKVALLEEIIMKATGIHSKDATCQITVNEANAQIGFEISGITREEAVGVRDFFAMTTGAESVDMIKNGEDSYLFPVTQAQMKYKLAPFFVAEFKKIDQDKLAAYKFQTEHFKENHLQKLEVLFAEIIRLSAELQSSDISAYVKGQLNIIFDQLLIPGLTEYHNNHKGHGCEVVKGAVEQSERVLGMYKDILGSNEALAANVSAKKLQDDTKKYLASAEMLSAESRMQTQEQQMRMQSLLQQMSMFGQQGRQQTAGLDLSNLNPYASDSSDEESEELGLMDKLRSAFGMRKQ